MRSGNSGKRVLNQLVRDVRGVVRATSSSSAEIKHDGGLVLTRSVHSRSSGSTKRMSASFAVSFKADLMENAIAKQPAQAEKSTGMLKSLLDGGLYYVQYILTSVISMVESVTNKPIKLAAGKTGHDGMYMRIESNVPLVKLISDGITGVAQLEDYSKGVITQTDLSDYMRLCSSDHKVGIGGCETSEKLLEFGRNNGDHLVGMRFVVITNTYFPPLQQQIKDNKVALHWVNLLADHCGLSGDPDENGNAGNAYSEEQEVIYIGDLQPSSMLAVIHAHDLQAFHEGEIVHNLLVHNEDLLHVSSMISKKELDEMAAKFKQTAKSETTEEKPVHLERGPAVHHYSFRR